MAASAIIGAVSAAMPALKSVLGRFIEDKDKRLEAEEAIERDFMSLLRAQDAAQSAINLADARSGNWVQTNWRPLLCWGAVIVWLSAHALPMFLMVLGEAETAFALRDLTDGAVDMMLFGLLGMSGYRTFERVKGRGKG